jgi:hypothetical protein
MCAGHAFSQSASQLVRRRIAFCFITSSYSSPYYALGLDLAELPSDDMTEVLGEKG